MDILKPINIQHKLLFGTEIEFCEANIFKLAELLKDDLNLEFVLSHKSRYMSFSKWCLDRDSSIKDATGINVSGGEVSSKILTNVSKDYEELVNICEFLVNNGALINEYCGNHIRVSINEGYDLNYFLEVFAKVIAVYEEELIHFFTGGDKLRKTFFEYSRYLNPALVSKLENLDFTLDNMFYRLLYGGVAVFTLRSGVNLQDFLKTGQIEFRYPDGSLNPHIIKNNIRMCLLIIDAILSYRFDLNDLNQKIICMNRDSQAMTKMLLSISEPQKFEELVDVISPTSDDKQLLLNQYNKEDA